MIGDRALGGEPMRVAALGRAVLDGLEAGGVVGVVKHMPGHGRAGGRQPRGTAGRRGRRGRAGARPRPVPRAARRADGDDRAHPLHRLGRGAAGQHLADVIGDIIRGEIGFDGLLMTDDLAMEALTGTPGERAAAAIGAGLRLSLCIARACSRTMRRSPARSGDRRGGGGAAGAGDGADRGKAPARIYEALAAKRDALLAFAQP